MMREHKGKKIKIRFVQTEECIKHTPTNYSMDLHIIWSEHYGGEVRNILRLSVCASDKGQAEEHLLGVLQRKHTAIAAVKLARHLGLQQLKPAGEIACHPVAVGIAATANLAAAATTTTGAAVAAH